MRRVGRYEIVREIGRGGMAVVYLARQTDLDRNVALKELGALQAMDPAFAARFLGESRITGSLSHPNIVTVHDYFEFGGLPYISMEYLERGSLRPRVGNLTLAQIAGVLEGLLAGLAYAEAAGIVHRDLKPENVMVTSDGGVKIADFGIAKAFNLASTGRFLTATGTTVGTPTYMAPEQAMAKDVGPWTDLYSVGVMAYELLVGQVPFYDTDTPMAILLRQVNEPIPSPLSLKPDLDPRLAEWLEHMLAKSPAERIRRAHDAWDELEDIVLSVLGPRWRREARVLDSGVSIEAPTPLTPAPFHEESDPEDQFETFRWGRHALMDPLAPSTAVEEARPELVAQSHKLTAEPPAPADPPVRPDEPVGSIGPIGPAGPVETVEPVRVTDGFRTYNPAPVPVAPAPAEPTPPPLAVTPAPAEPAPAPEPASVEPTPTLPPMRRPHAPSYQLPALGRKRKVRPLWVGLALLAAGVAASAVAFAGLGGSSKHVAPRPAAAHDAWPAPSERAALAVSGSSLYLASARGRIVRLARSPLVRQASIQDPAAPRTLALAGDRVYVADGSTLTSLRSESLAPVAAVPFGGAVAFAAGTGAPSAVAAQVGTGRGRLCALGVSGVGPCVRLPFAPSGAGAARSGSRLFVANGAAGTVLQYRRTPTGLAAGTPIPLGPGTQPHGTLIPFAGSLYVPVTRGVAVVDIATGRRSRTIRLSTTPVDIWIVPFNGRLFAPLYAGNAVAVVDAVSPHASPRLVRAGKHPVAVGGPLTSSPSGNVVYVLNAGGRLARLDALTGRLLGSTRIGALTGKAARPAAAAGVTFAESGRTLRATIRFSGGRLDTTSLAVADEKIADGRASLEVWQGAIGSTVRRAQRLGLTLTVAPAAGHLVVSASARRGAFTALHASLGRDRRSIVLELTRKPKAQKRETPKAVVQAVTTPYQPPTHSTYSPPAQTTHTYTPPKQAAPTHPAPVQKQAPVHPTPVHPTPKPAPSDPGVVID